MSLLKTAKDLLTHVFTFERKRKSPVGQRRKDKKRKETSTKAEDLSTASSTKRRRKCRRIQLHEISTMEEEVRGTKSSAKSRKIYRGIQLYEPRIKPELCSITIKSARNLHNGIGDIVDTPDPYVEVTILDSAEVTQQTTVKPDDRNPVWNETLHFHINGDPDVEIKVRESNYISDGEHGLYTCKLSNIPTTIHLYEDAELEVEVSHKRITPDLWCTNKLSEDEYNFIKRRQRKVLWGLKRLLGYKAPKRPEQVPKIAIMGSGGGFRAMTAFGGAIKALADTGILDCATYTAGLSGSSWYLSTLYSHPEWPNIHPSKINSSIKENITQNPKDKIFDFSQYIASIKEKLTQGLPWSFTDVFADMIGETLIPDRKDVTWSSQSEKLSDGQTPLPLLACVHVDEDRSTKEFHEWIEMSPFEVHMSKYGTSIRMQDMGSDFFHGKIVNRRQEPELHFIQGICGSAFTALYKSRREMSAKTSRFSQSDDTATTGDVNHTWLDSLVGVLDSFNLNYLDDRTGRAAQVPNWMRNLPLDQLEEIPSPTKFQNGKFEDGLEEMDTSQEHLCLVDAGLAFNSPYPLLMRPGRNIDLILSFEFTDRHGDEKMPFKEILLAKEWADCHRMPFPPIDVKQYEGKPVQEVYIFEDEKDPNCPIIMHFVLVNNAYKNQDLSMLGKKKRRRQDKFRNFTIYDDPEQPYDSLNFQYSHLQSERLSHLMEFNVHHSLDLITECIDKCVQRRQSSTFVEQSDTSRGVPLKLRMS